jgi:hypothetical protein
MEVNHDGVRYSCSDFPDNDFARICPISDNYDFHRTADVSEIKNRLCQIHFLPGGHENGRVEHFLPGVTYSAVTIAHSFHTAAGAIKAPFHLLTTIHTNEQGSSKPTRQVSNRERQDLRSR